MEGWVVPSRFAALCILPACTTNERTRISWSLRRRSIRSMSCIGGPPPIRVVYHMIKYCYYPVIIPSAILQPTGKLEESNGEPQDDSNSHCLRGWGRRLRRIYRDKGRRFL